MSYKIYICVLYISDKMSISNRTECNSNNNKMPNSAIQVNEISSSDSNNNSEGKHLYFTRGGLECGGHFRTLV